MAIRRLDVMSFPACQFRLRHPIHLMELAFQPTRGPAPTLTSTLPPHTAHPCSSLPLGGHSTFSLLHKGKHKQNTSKKTAHSPSVLRTERQLLALGEHLLPSSFLSQSVLCPRPANGRMTSERKAISYQKANLA